MNVENTAQSNKEEVTRGMSSHWSVTNQIEIDKHEFTRNQLTYAESLEYEDSMLCRALGSSCHHE